MAGRFWIRGGHPWTTAWIFLLTLFSQGMCQYQLSGPLEYTIFKGDFLLDYTIPMNATLVRTMVQLIDIRNDTTITTGPVPTGYMEGQLTFLCGVIDHAGRFQFRMIREFGGPILAQTEIIEAKWPTFQLSLPPQHQALESEVVLQFNAFGGICDTRQRNSRYYIDVVYFGKNDTGLTLDEMQQIHPRQLLDRREITEFDLIVNTAILFECTLFDQAGLYRIDFISNHDFASPIASSNIMYVEWSNQYSIEFPPMSILPCYRFITVSYTHPRCAGSEDKIRLYRLIHIAESSLASPTNLEYIAEQRARSGASIVSFDCTYFHETVPGYCFKYISMASNSAVTEQATLCIPTTDQPDIVVNGGWSDWVGWSACSLTCGTGQQSRYRTCDNPSPTWGGRYCPGDSVEWRDCSYYCGGESTKEPFNPYPPVPGCECGCNLNKDDGQIVGSTRCLGSSSWIIRVALGKVIELSFPIFTIDRTSPYTWLKIRDGASPMDDLLLHTTGGQTPPTVTSKGNEVRIEFMAPYVNTEGYGSQHEAFVALFRAKDSNATLVVADNGDGNTQAWITAVTLVGIGFCAIIIVLVISFVIHNRMQQKREKKLKTQATQSLLVNGEMPNSPSHSGHSAMGSANISFSDPPSSPTKRDYVLPAGANGSPTHVAPQKSQKSPPPPYDPPSYGDKSPEHHSRHSSVSTISRRHESPGTPNSAVYAMPADLPSPYHANSSSGDYIHQPGQYQRREVSPTRTQKHRSHGGRSRHSRSPDSTLTSPNAPSHVATVGSRSQSSVGSGSSRPDPRNPSFRKAVSNKPGVNVPLADEEDLSPLSPTEPTRSKVPTSRHSQPWNSNGEKIPLDNYEKHRPKKMRGVADTHLGSPRKDGIPEARPPVEGRDSLRHHPASSPQPMELGTPPTPDQRNHNFVQSDKPHLKPLPLRSVQRPDGQSPENRVEDPNANTPSTSSLSPILQKSRLFTDSSATPSDSITLADEYEYDDYMPNLPGSYFTMDPSAYTLTWSQQPPWAQQRHKSLPNSHPGSHTTSQGSMGSIDRNGESNA